MDTRCLWIFGVVVDGCRRLCNGLTTTRIGIIGVQFLERALAMSDDDTLLHEAYNHENTPGLDADELPPGWVPFDPDDGEAICEEAYLYANGHQVVITENNFVLAYPEQHMTDLCGIIRPLATDEQGMNPAARDPFDTREAARKFTLGYMQAVLKYEYLPELDESGVAQ